MFIFCMVKKSDTTCSYWNMIRNIMIMIHTSTVKDLAAGGGAAGVSELTNQTLDGEEFLKRRNDVSKSINVKKASCCRIQSNFFVKKTKVGKKFQWVEVVQELSTDEDHS